MDPLERDLRKRNKTTEASCGEWRLVRAGKRSSMAEEAWRPTVILHNMTHTCWEKEREREANSGERKKERFTPFNSFLPEGGKMLTYLEAMRRPKKHMVNTLAIGITAILIVPSTDSPAATAVGISMRSERIRVIIPTKTKEKSSDELTWVGIWEKSGDGRQIRELMSSLFVMMIVWESEREGNQKTSLAKDSLSLCHVFLF